MRRILKVLGISRLAILVWAWRRRTKILDWIRFALSVPGRPWPDVRSEFFVRMRLRRIPARISVHDSVVTLEGRLTSSEHKAAREALSSMDSVTRVDDRVVPSKERPPFRFRTA